MAARKVECRFRAGTGPYSRAGEQWTSEFQPVPKDLLRDDDKMKLLVEDPHLEVKVDGVFISGPRAETSDGSDQEATEASDALQGQIEELKGRLDASDADLRKAEGDLAALRTGLDAAKAKATADEATIAALTKELETLKSAPAASTTPSITPPATDTTPDSPKAKQKA